MERRAGERAGEDEAGDGERERQRFAFADPPGAEERDEGELARTNPEEGEGEIRREERRRERL